MSGERQLELNDTLNYVSFLLRNCPEVSLERKREIAREVSEIDDAERLKRTILNLAGVEATTMGA